MEVKPGYKLTEVGVIPKNWEVKKFLDLCILQRGFDITEETKQKGNIPVISSSGLTYYHNEAKVKPPGVVTGRKGMLGNVYYLENPFWPHDTTLWVKDFRGNYPLYVYYYLISFKLQRFDAATSVPTLNRNNLSGENVAIPPLPEQTAIATALSDVDALISGLDRLIEKKRAIKQAALQELLTGKRRLPGFDSGKGYKQTEVGEIPEDWEVNKIGQISVIDPENLPGNTDPNYTFNYISLEDVDYGRLLSFKELIFSDSPSRARRKLKQGDILFSTVRPNLKSHLFFSSTSNRFICSTGFSVVRCDEKLINPKYVYFHLFGTIIEKQIDALITGSNYPAINSTDVKSMNLPIPPLPEQTAIATVLSDMDAEISALETRRAKTISLKQGMMQELLTGRIRLV